ncbi:hypothetical protein KY366_05430, partial [Candidatus Woesearchaeota archaeon]|nr:hypothetical protein [Candidatus Woesearchaeota archaeon]
MSNKKAASEREELIKEIKEIKEINRQIKGYSKDSRGDVRIKIVPFIPVMGILLLIVLGLFTPLTPIGLVAIESQFNYSDSVGLAVNKSQAYTWTMANYGSLSSVKLDGFITKRGSAMVYLEYGNNSYTVFDSSRLEESGFTLITGLAVANNTTDSIQNTSINDSVDDENNSTGDKIIDIAVLGGGSKAEDDVFELDLASSFSWDVDYDKVCTKWSINSVGVCHGSEDCCAFLNMESSGGWDSALHLSYGRYESGKNNTVSAQV